MDRGGQRRAVMDACTVIDAWNVMGRDQRIDQTMSSESKDALSILVTLCPSRGHALLAFKSDHLTRSNPHDDRTPRTRSVRPYSSGMVFAHQNVIHPLIWLLAHQFVPQQTQENCNPPWLVVVSSRRVQGSEGWACDCLSL